MTLSEQFKTWCMEVQTWVEVWEERLDLDEPVLIVGQLLKRVTGKPSNVAGLEIVIMTLINQRFDTELTFSDSSIVSLFVNGLMKDAELTEKSIDRLMGLKDFIWFSELKDLIDLCRENVCE